VSRSAAEYDGWERSPLERRRSAIVGECQGLLPASPHAEMSADGHSRGRDDDSPVRRGASARPPAGAGIDTGDEDIDMGSICIEESDVTVDGEAGDDPVRWDASVSHGETAGMVVGIAGDYSVRRVAPSHWRCACRDAHLDRTGMGMVACTCRACVSQALFWYKRSGV
jgi:hypothetical protein